MYATQDLTLSIASLVILLFLAPTGAQEMIIFVLYSVPPFGPNLFNAPNLHLPGSDLSAVFN